jgi:hypothetical protein
VSSEDYKALLRGQITSEEYVRRLKADVDRRLSRPVTRVGRYLIFPGGRVVRLSRREQLLFAIGLKTSTTNHERSARL